MSDFGWDYPPGVTGNEPQISGVYQCVNCGRALSEEAPCPTCGGELDWRDRECDWFCEKCNKAFDGDTCVGGCAPTPWDHDQEDDEREDARALGEAREAELDADAIQAETVEEA